MRKEESGYGPVSPVTDHPVRPRTTRQPGVRPVRGETDHREPSHPHDDTPSGAVGDNAAERSRVPGRRGRTLILFSIVTPIIVLTMSVVVAIAINKCPYSEEILDPVVMFTSLYTGGLLSYVFVREMTKKKGGSDETT